MSAKARALIEGAFELEQWHFQGRVHRAPEVQARMVYCAGTVTVIFRNEMVPGQTVTNAQLGHYRFEDDGFIYGYDDRWSFTEKDEAITVVNGDVFGGYRQFDIASTASGINLVSRVPGQALFEFTPQGVAYHQDGALLRVWRRVVA